jgi:hypothetical protein
MGYDNKALRYQCRPHVACHMRHETFCEQTVAVYMCQMSALKTSYRCCYRLSLLQPLMNCCIYDTPIQTCPSFPISQHESNPF